VRFNLFTRRQVLGIVFFAVAGYLFGFLLGTVTEPYYVSGRTYGMANIGLVLGIFVAIGYLLLKNERQIR
jgi:hypothetical protein